MFSLRTRFDIECNPGSDVDAHCQTPGLWGKILSVSIRIAMVLLILAAIGSAD
jgi:hypothetical protein